MAVVHISYFTDPACPWSWALEPSLRRLTNEFGDEVAITYVMSGMAREFGKPEQLVAEALAAADRSGMPVDPRLWLDSPPLSSYPACMAVKAAGEQGDPAPYLRRLREGFMCRRRKLDTTDALLDEARFVDGLDVERFRIDLRSHAILESFGADLDRAAAIPAEHRAAGANRPELPSLEFRGEDGAVDWSYGFVEYPELAAGVVGAGGSAGGSVAGAGGGGGLGVEEALARWGALATAEVAAVCGLRGPRAPAELWRLAAEWQVKAERVGSGELWTLA